MGYKCANISRAILSYHFIVKIKKIVRKINFKDIFLIALNKNKRNTNSKLVKPIYICIYILLLFDYYNPRKKFLK